MIGRAVLGVSSSQPVRSFCNGAHNPGPPRPRVLRAAETGLVRRGRRVGLVAVETVNYACLLRSPRSRPPSPFTKLS